MTNKTFTYVAALLLAIGLLCAPPAVAQTATTQTTTTLALTDTTTNVVTLTSVTNVVSNGYLFIDGEAMQITAAASGLFVPVRRGALGTAAKTHATAAVAYVFAAGLQARVGLMSGPLPGSSPSGSCTRANQPLLPVFNVTTNQRFDCLNSNWVATGEMGTVLFCGASTGNATCTNASAITARTIGGIATLASNSAVISGISPAFTSVSTYTCVANDLTTRANPVQVANTSTSSITITNTTGAADVINYLCVGY